MRETLHRPPINVDQTLRLTPVMQVELARHVWEIDELVALID